VLATPFITLCIKDLSHAEKTRAVDYVFMSKNYI